MFIPYSFQKGLAVALPDLIGGVVLHWRLFWNIPMASACSCVAQHLCGNWLLFVELKRRACEALADFCMCHWTETDLEVTWVLIGRSKGIFRKIKRNAFWQN